MVVIRRHVQDRTDIVQITFRHRAATTASRTDDERLEGNDERALLQVEELRSDCFVHY